MQVRLDSRVIVWSSDVLFYSFSITTIDLNILKVYIKVLKNMPKGLGR